MPTTPLPAALATRLDRLSPVVGVHTLTGSDGGGTDDAPADRAPRTFVVDHRDAPATVVHLRGEAHRLEHEARATRLAHAAGVGPEVLDVVPQVPALVTRFVEGEVLDGERLRDPTVLDEVVTAVRRLHDVPAVGQPDCDPIAHRAAYLAAARERGIVWDPVVRAAEDRSGETVNRLLATRHDSSAGAGAVLCHGDLVPENLIRTARGVVLIDLEYAGAGEAAFDLGNLVACAELSHPTTRDLVRAYCGADDAQVLARVEDWATVLRHAWYVWVVLGDDLGPGRERWSEWAGRVHAAWAREAGATGPGAAE